MTKITELQNKLIEQLTERLRFQENFSDHIYKNDIVRFREAYEYANKQTKSK